MPLLVGAATTSITPERDLPNYYGSVLGRGEGDADLLCHAVTVSDGDTEVAIVSCDATMVDRPLVLRIREEAQRRTGIPAANMLIAATHTHAAPAPCPSFLAGALPDPLYLDLLAERAVAAVQEAWRRRRQAQGSAGVCATPGFEYNRRFLRDDGNATLVPGVGSNLPPAGPVDRSMQFLAFRDEQGEPIAVVVNYPCHNNCCSGSYHRDLGGRAGDALRERLGTDLVTPFLPAPCGDVVWLDLLQPRGATGDALAWEIGRGIADGLVAAMEDVQWRGDAALTLRSETIDVPDRALAESTFCHDLCRGDSEAAVAFARRRYDPEREAVASRGSTVCPVEIQAFSLGFAAVVANPAELFCAFGIEIKQHSPFPVTLVSELSNGYCGYVPTREAFAQRGYGTHRTVYTSRLAIDGGERITAKSNELLTQLAAARA